MRSEPQVAKSHRHDVPPLGSSTQCAPNIRHDASGGNGETTTRLPVHDMRANMPPPPREIRARAVARPPWAENGFSCVWIPQAWQPSSRAAPLQGRQALLSTTSRPTALAQLAGIPPCDADALPACHGGAATQHICNSGQIETTHTHTLKKVNAACVSCRTMASVARFPNMHGGDTEMQRDTRRTQRA